jgi:RNA polymerase sigma-70 factor (ECF subfamily)
MESMAATPADAVATSAPDPFSASRLRPEAARARTEELFRMHGRLVVGLCRGLLRNAHEAEDAAQQAFLSVHSAFLRGAQPDDPARWLAAIARNECLTRIREHMRHPLPFFDADDTASTADPVAEAARRADMSALWRAVGALAPRQRDALLLREFAGLSYDELAIALGVSVPSVESLLFRARTRLRLELRVVTAALSGLVPRLLAGGGAAKVVGVTVAASLLTGGVVASERQFTDRSIPLPRAASAPNLANVLPDVPIAATPAPAARPVARPVVRHAQHPHPTPVVFTPPTRTPAPATHSPRGEDPTAQPAASESSDGRAPVVATEDESTATVPTEDMSGDTQQMTTTTEESTDGSTAELDETGEPTTSSSDGGADTSGS